jgi:hypothetical protein
MHARKIIEETENAFGSIDTARRIGHSDRSLIGIWGETTSKFTDVSAC